MEPINSALSSYLQENFYSIYPGEEMGSIAEADLILIGAVHDDTRFQQIYQTFINLFPAALVLIENRERGQPFKYKECEMSWKINPSISVQGWNEASYLQAIREACPCTCELSKIQNREKYHQVVKNKPSKHSIPMFFKQMLTFGAMQEFPLKSAIDIENYSLCQNAMLETIQESLQQEKRPVILVGGYLHVKISPNGYKHPLLDSYVKAQLQISPGYRVPFPEDNKIIGDEPVESLPEPQWRQRFHHMFAGKKIVLLVDKPLIVDLARFFDKTIDYSIYRIENKVF